MFLNCFEIITIGLPFCGFKVLTGLFFNQYWLIALGVIDLLINMLNLLSLLFLKRRLFDACFLSFLIRFLKKQPLLPESKWQDLGNATDVFLSFALVAYVIGGGFIKLFPSHHVLIWNISVVLNVLGAGYSRLSESIRNLKFSDSNY
jgi:hypothetical protein